MQSDMTTWQRQKPPAFTLVELLVVIAIIAILAGLLLPALARGKMKAQQVQCVADLKQVGVAFHAFLHDHNGRFPMQVSTNDGGTLEYVYASYLIPGQFYFQYRHFQALSNELATPKLLACPADRDRFAATNFQDFNNLNISYFVGANAEYSLPNSMLAGDRNLTNGAWGGRTIIRLGDGSGLYWGAEMHQFRGNILYADARVEELTTAGLQLASFGAPPVMDLVGPSLQTSSSSPPSGPALTPPPNLPSAPAPPSSRSRPTASASAASGNNSGGYGTPGSVGRTGSSSRPQTLPSPALNSVSGTTNKMIHASIAKTNAAPEVSNAPPAVLAETPVQAIHQHSHMPWWFWLWVVLLLAAIEGTRRYYLRLRKERKNHNPWSRYG